MSRCDMTVLRLSHLTECQSAQHADTMCLTCHHPDKQRNAGLHMPDSPQCARLVVCVVGTMQGVVCVNLGQHGCMLAKTQSLAKHAVTLHTQFYKHTLPHMCHKGARVELQQLVCSHTWETSWRLAQSDMGCMLMHRCRPPGSWDCTENRSLAGRATKQCTVKPCDSKTPCRTWRFAIVPIWSQETVGARVLCRSYAEMCGMGLRLGSKSPPREVGTSDNAPDPLGVTAWHVA